MKRNLVRIAVALALCVWLLGPAFENVDPWDIFPDTGDNIILILTALTVLLGAVLCLALLIAKCLQPAGKVAPLDLSPIPFPPMRDLLRDSAWWEWPQPLRI